MKKKYRVTNKVVGDGIQKLDDPRPRRIYRPGEVIELDDEINNPQGLLDMGMIEELELPKLTLKKQEDTEEVD